MNSKNLFYAVCVQGVALFLAFVIYYAGNEKGPEAFLFTLSISTLSLFATCFLVKLNAEAYRGRELRRELLDYFYRIAYYRARGGSYFKALFEAQKSAKHSHLKERISQTARKHLMSGKRARGDGNWDENTIRDGEDGVREVIRMERLRASSRQAEMEESTQRYATFSMFISTIAPSFLVFAFVGNAVLSQGGFGMALFSSTLLLLIPFLYAISNLLMWRRLFA